MSLKRGSLSLIYRGKKDDTKGYLVDRLLSLQKKTENDYRANGESCNENEDKVERITSAARVSPERHSTILRVKPVKSYQKSSAGVNFSQERSKQV